MWIKLQVNVRHHSPERVSGPKSAPHLRMEIPVGNRKFTPQSTISRKMATLMYTKIGVAILPFRGVSMERNVILLLSSSMTPSFSAE